MKHLYGAVCSSDVQLCFLRRTVAYNLSAVARYGGLLAQLVTSLVALTKLINAGPG